MSFTPKAELTAVFKTEGAFYRRIAEGEEFNCRSLAKITRRDAGTREADAVFVMVNPGSCEPENSCYTYPLFTKNYHQVPLIPAKTDPTQVQIMRLMERQNWDCVYVVNLSDLCSGNIDTFKQLKKRFETSWNDTHSIFSEPRIQEIEYLIGEKTVFIAAWGTQSSMASSMMQALTLLPSFGPVCGLPHAKHPYYLHPKPMLKQGCINWLNEMCNSLDKKTCVR